MYSKLKWRSKYYGLRLLSFCVVCLLPSASPRCPRFVDLSVILSVSHRPIERRVTGRVGKGKLRRSSLCFICVCSPRRNFIMIYDTIILSHALSFSIFTGIICILYFRYKNNIVNIALHESLHLQLQKS